MEIEGARGAMRSHATPVIRWMDDGPSPPAWNMAVDNALLAAANNGRLPGTWVRFFAWDPPAISIGRLQDATTALDLAALEKAGIPVVRRLTGGQAVFHAREVTYSVIGAIPDPTFGRTLHETYRVVTGLIGDALARLGIPVTLAPGRRGGEGSGSRDLRAACFATAFGHELEHAGRKICGSAQRRLVHAFLQHGSLLLGPEHARLAAWIRTDVDRDRLQRRLLAGATDVTAALARPVSYGEITGVLIDSLKDRWGAGVVPGRLPVEIAAQARAEMDEAVVLPGSRSRFDDNGSAETAQTEEEMSR